MLNKNMLYSTLPTPRDLLLQLPITPQQQAFIAQSRQQIRGILSGKDRRRLLIVGPCSVHQISSATEYALRLKELSNRMADQFFIVMRTYLEKPRSSLGWTGFVNDPQLDKSYDIEQGLTQARELLLALADLKLPCGMEFLSLPVHQYLGDLISWGCIGSRTGSSQPHRQLASGMSMPVGFKNGTNGSVESAVHAVTAAQAGHHFLGVDMKGRCAAVHTKGNPDTHIVLRGGFRPNYDAVSVQHVMQRLRQENLAIRLLIDCSHGNSHKEHEKQPLVFQSVIEQMQAGNEAIVGALLESHLKAGSQRNRCHGQKPQGNISWTDPCIGWDTTEHLIEWAYEQLRKQQTIPLAQPASI